MNILLQKLEKVNDKQSFIEFLEALKKDNELSTEEWENLTINSYLEAARAWLIDSNREADDNQWKLLAEFLYAGKIYE